MVMKNGCEAILHELNWGFRTLMIEKGSYGVNYSCNRLYDSCFS